MERQRIMEAQGSAGQTQANSSHPCLSLAAPLAEPRGLFIQHISGQLLHTKAIWKGVGLT